jgi:hypothetical protein
MPWEPDYCTAEELTEFARAGVEDADWVDLARGAASRAVDRRCGGKGSRQFGQVDAPTTRIYTPRWSVSKGGWVVHTADLMTTTGLVIELDAARDGLYSTVLDLASVTWLDEGAPERNRPWEKLLIGNVTGFVGRRGELRITARWGWSSVPTVVREATLLQASRYLMRRDSPFGIAGTPENGSELRLLSRLDPDVALMLADYTRKVWAR